MILTNGKGLTKKAFLVGINDYSPAGPGEKDLNGCVNDVSDIGNMRISCEQNSDTNQ